MITNPSLWGALHDSVSNNVYNLVGSGGPSSGTLGSGVGVSGIGSLYTDYVTGIVYFNEGTRSSPYWTPVSYLNPKLMAWASDFRDAVGKANSDTAALYTIPGSGIKVFGEGIAETDSGFEIAIAENGAIGTLQVTDEVDHTAALGVGATTSVPFQPDAHGPMVVDATVAMVTANTLRRMFFGWVGTAADNLVSPVTGATVTLTLVQDDLAGLFFDVGLTLATTLMAAHNKSDEAATLLVAATGVNTGVTIPTAATYMRLRVEILANGTMVCFKDKVQIASIAASLDVNEEMAPVFLLGSTSTAVKAAVVKRFAAWGKAVL